MKKQQLILTIIIIILFLISITLIGTGIYYLKLTSSNNVIYNFLDKEDNIITEILKKNYDYNFNDKYTITSKINSTYTSEEQTTNEFINKLSTIFSNLSTLNTEFSLSEDKTTNKALLKINTTRNQNEYINLKYYIKDSTGFYYNKTITDNYINVGNNNFFETINKNTSTEDNLNTLKKIIKEYTAKELEENFLYTSKSTIDYNNNSINSNIYTIKLTNNDINRLIRLVLKDLKSNSTSNNILKNYISNFKDLKLKDNIEFLNTNEFIELNIYTNEYKYDLLKIDFTYSTKNNSYKITQEFLNNKENIYYIENDALKYNFKITKNDKSYVLTILNNKDKKIGKGTYTKNSREEILDINITDSNIRIYIDYTSNNKNNNIKSNYELKYIENNKNVLTYTLNIDTNFTKKVKLVENTTNSQLKSSLSDSQKELYNNFFNIVKKDIIGE